MMKGLLDSLLGRGPRLYPFEVAVIEKVVACLGGDAGFKLQRQVEEINKIQRLSEGKEVNLYKMSGGRPSFDDGLSFGGIDDEALLATVSLTGSATKKGLLKIELWLVYGRLFSLVSNKKPSEFFMTEQLDAVQPTITDVKIWLDPMRPEKILPCEADISLSGWLYEWQKQGSVSDLRAPLTPKERMDALKRIDAALPADYVEMLSQSDGLKIGEYQIYGAMGLRKIVTEDANYYALAESGLQRGLVVKENSADSELFLLDYEEDSIRPIGKSLQEAVESALSIMNDPHD